MAKRTTKLIGEIIFFGAIIFAISTIWSSTHPLATIAIKIGRSRAYCQSFGLCSISEDLSPGFVPATAQINDNLIELSFQSNRTETMFTIDDPIIFPPELCKAFSLRQIIVQPGIYKVKRKDKTVWIKAKVVTK